MRCRPSLVRGRAAQVNPGGFTTPARRPSVPHRTAGCGKSSLRPLMAEWSRPVFAGERPVYIRLPTFGFGSSSAVDDGLLPGGPIAAMRAEPMSRTPAGTRTEERVSMSGRPQLGTREATITVCLSLRRYLSEGVPSKPSEGRRIAASGSRQRRHLRDVYPMIGKVAGPGRSVAMGVRSILSNPTPRAGQVSLKKRRCLTR
jgi:hypothetical protein